MSMFIRCNGNNCRKEWPALLLGEIRGPALVITRVDGMSGAGMPNADEPFHLCVDCGRQLMDALKRLNDTTTKKST